MIDTSNGWNINDILFSSTNSFFRCSSFQPVSLLFTSWVSDLLFDYTNPFCFIASKLTVVVYGMVDKNRLEAVWCFLKVYTIFEIHWFWDQHLSINTSTIKVNLTTLWFCVVCIEKRNRKKRITLKMKTKTLVAFPMNDIRMECRGMKFNFPVLCSWHLILWP